MTELMGAPKVKASEGKTPTNTGADMTYQVSTSNASEEIEANSAEEAARLFIADGSWTRGHLTHVDVDVDGESFSVEVPASCFVDAE